MTQGKGVTIREIAAKAGVSVSTVSRVLTGNTPVNEEKREAVLQAIEALNYQPNFFAQSLVSGSSYTVGVLTQNISSRFYNLVLQGIINVLHDSDYSPLIADGNWQIAQEGRALNLLLGRRVDGLIVLGGASPESTLRRIADQLPLVVLGRALPSLIDQCVSFDDFEGGRLATRFLIERGYRRIAHITGILSHEDAALRRDGYLQALGDAGIPLDPRLIVEGQFIEESGVAGVERLVGQGIAFDAIFAANDQMAIGALLGLARHGYRVPDEVALVGFDDQSPSAYLLPPLTTIRQPAVEMGEVAARAMLAALRGDPIKVSAFPAQLVIRESVGMRPRGD